MISLPWLDHLPGNSIEAGIDLANTLYWNISSSKHEQEWYVWSGECLIFETDSEEALQAFLYGLGLAYGVLPPRLIDYLHGEVQRLAGFD